jgi:amino acid adenylation domain-containing protein
VSDPVSVQDRLAGLSREQRALLFEQIRKRQAKERAAAPPDRIPRRPPSLEPAPLSFAQERLWFIDRLQPGLTAYNIPMALRIEGEVSPAVLAAILGEVVRRHDALRTTFHEVEGRPVQVVSPAGRWILPLADLSSLPEEARAAEARRLAQEEADRPFDLGRGPLLRAALLRLGPAEHALLLAMHHVVSDGWSMGVFVREITALYGAARSAGPSPLPELLIQYADFAVWQRGWLQGEVLERQVAYWREKLAGVPASLDLPLDRPRPADPTYRGARVRVPLDAGFTRQLGLLARRHEATPFMVLLAGFQALLGRLSGQEDLTVGSPIANRNRAEIEPLIGFFVNTLVLRGDLAGDPSFAGLLARVRRTSLEAYAHQDLPFERLVEELRPERHLAINPLFQVLFALQNVPVDRADLPGLSLAPLELEATTAQFDLELSLAESADGMVVEVAYSTELFDAPTPRRLAAHLETLLRGAMAGAGQRLSELPLLSAGERRQLVLEWNDTGAPAAEVGCAHEIVERQAALTPAAVAVEHGDEGLTYRDLVARARRLAEVLGAAGVGPDMPVGLWAGRSLALPVGVLGILQAGGACVPLDLSYPAERLAMMIGDAGLRLVVAEQEALADLPAGRLESLETIVIDRRGKIVPEAAEPSPAEVVPPGPENLLYVLFTSGSTGRPKGVALPHRALVNLVAWTLAVRPARGRRVLQFSPISFDVSFEEMFSTWGSGGTLVLMPEEMRRDPAALLSYLVEKRIERLFQPFVALQQLAEVAGEPGRTPLPLRELVTAGEQLRITGAVAGLFRDGARLFNEYGPTETHVTTAFLLPGATGEWTALPPIGRPVANHQVHLLDRRQRPVPVGVPGELCIGGAGLARGYLGRPDLTAERFLPDPCGPQPGGRLYRTGDLARRAGNGELEYLGRIDHQVKIRGFRIEPGEIEAALAGQPQVREAAVVVRQDPPGGRRLVAYLVWDGEAGSEAELREALEARLPSPMLPSALVAVPALPLTPSGKVDRRALAGPRFSPADAGGGSDPAERAEPATASEREIAAIWREVLGLEQVAAGDDFFDLGGHSLLAVQVLSRIRGRLGVDLPVRVLFEAPTLAGLARRADAARGETGAAPPPAAGELGSREAPLSFGQERLWLLDRLEPGTPAFNMSSPLLLRGPLDAQALSLAFQEIRRHQGSLRTRFEEREGSPVQVVDPPGPWQLPRIALQGLPEPLRHAEAERLAAEEASRPFDLERGPLFRPVLLHLDGAEHLLLLTCHHIISDGWSTSVLIHELKKLYAAFAAGGPPPRPEPPALQYAQFAAWQRERLAGPGLEAQLAYWREQLSGAPPLLDLPLDRPRSAVQTRRGREISLRLPADSTGALKVLAVSETASLYMTLLAALALLLHRWSGQPEVVIGSPMAGRDQRETEGLIGFFLNLLPMRVELSGRPTFRELLRRTRQVALEAFGNQDVPFERVLQELRLEREASYAPVFQVMLNMLNLPPVADELPGGISVESWTLQEVESNYDFTLYALDDGEGLSLRLVYNLDLFEGVRMEELLRQYRQLLEQVCADAERPIAALSLLTPAAAAVLPDPVAPLGEAWHGAVHELFFAQARRHPERAAVADPEGSWTYGELAAAAGRLAASLRAAGLERGDRVAIWAHRSAPVAWSVMGTLAAGGAFVMLDPAYPAARLIEILRLAEPRAWLALAAAAAPPREVEEWLAGWQREGRLLCRAELPGGGPAGARRFLAELPSAVGPVVTGPDDLAFIAFTSGSTGMPKGILGRHGPLSHFLPWQCQRFGLTAADRYSLLSGLAHDPLQRDLFTSLCTGAALCAPDPEEVFGPGKLAAWAAAQGITVAHLTPALGQVLTEPPGDGGEPSPMPSLRWVFLVGDVLTRLDVDRIRRLAPGVSCVNLYGSTETQRTVGYHVVDPQGGAAGQRARQVLPLGRGIEDVQILVVNAAERLAGVGEVGEIWMRSPHLAQGYLGDEALTRERFRINPFTGGEPDRVYRTGDLGRYLPGGEVTFAGRVDDQVKIRGFRIEPGEIASAIGRLEGVREAVVVPREDGGERYLAAYVVPEPGAVPGLAGRLRPFLATRLPEYMVPAAFVELPALPLTPNGKVDRRALPAPKAAAGRGETAPCNPLEEALAGIWRELLDIEQVCLEDDFFELGGHSLLATQLLSRVRTTCGVDLPLRRLFEHPTLGGLAAVVASAGAVSAAHAAVPRRPPGLHPLPASFAQERLWFLDRLEPGNPAYNIPTALRLLGEVSPALLEAILGAVVRRHEALRTTFRERDGQPVQVVAPAAPWTLPVIDLAGLPEETRAVEARRLAQLEAFRPFDLERGPLLRAALLRLAGAEHGLLLAMHHIVSDGWSMGVLVREITALYEAALAGTPPRLAELPIQYADFAVWQRSWLTGAELERQLSYWRERLAGLPASLDLPTDRPRPSAPTHRGAQAHAVWGPDLARDLYRFARGQGATLFMVLLAAFQALLCRLSRQEDVPVGSPIANRNRTEIEPLIGFFVNTLVLRGDLSGDPSFRELLARVRRTTLEAYAHQDLPFERLVEELRPERRLALTPLFQVMCTLQNMPLESVDLPGLSFAPLEIERAAAQFDLDLSVWEADGAVVLTFTYSVDLFDAPTVQRLTGYLETLLQGALAGAGRRLSDLPLLSAAELAQLRGEWNDTGRNDLPDIPLHRLVEARALAAPAAMAVLSAAGESLTYGELDARAGRLAGRLRDLGVGPESRVVIATGRSPDLVVGMLAVLKAGGAYVPIDPDYPAERISLILEDSAAPVLLAGERLRERGNLPAGPARILALDGAGREGPVFAGGEAVDPAGAAYVIYTSGSTGRPKGVVVTHRSIAWHVRSKVEDYHLGPGARALQFSSLGFDASVEEIWCPLIAGATLVLRSEEAAGTIPRFLEEVERLGITMLGLPTAFWRELATGLDEEGAALPAAVRLTVIGGEEAQPHHLASWFRGAGRQVTLLNSYGPTEATIAATFAPVQEWNEGEPVPIGRPKHGARVSVVDHGLRLVPIGVWGELLIGGMGVARGYLGRPDLTAERFVPDAWSGEPGGRVYRSGDLVRFGTDGKLQFGGRIDQQVKVRGFRIEPGEIEAALAAHPRLRDAAVVARRAPRGVSSLLACVVSTDEDAPGVSEVRAFLSERLPSHMVPSAFAFLPRLPLTPNGKVDRRALERLQPEEAGAPSAPPRTPVEELLAGLWQEILGVERVGRSDSFFDLGGHSLAATRLVSRLAAGLGVEIPLRAVFEAPTVAELAGRFVAPALAAGVRTRTGPPPLVARPAGEPAPLSFGQERLWFLDRLEPGNTAFNMGSSLRLRGRLDVAALEQSLNEVVRRHEPLRSSFAEVEGRPVLRIAAVLPIDLSLVDLSPLPEAAREAEAERVARASLASPFDLAGGPLIRASLLRLAGDLHLFLLGVHHIVSDGWSVGVMNRELIALYAAFSAGQPSPLPPLSIQYGDFARWQREWLRGEALEAQLAYWRDQLGGHLPPLDLATDRPRPAVQTFRGRALPLHVPEETGRALRTLSHRHGASLFMTVLAAFQVLLSRLSGQPDVVVGSPIAGRRHVETEGLIGFFLNTLALRTDLSGNPSFRELLGRVRETTLDAYAHQDTPFEALLAELNPERDLSRTPVFQVFLNMLNLPPGDSFLPGLEVEAGAAPEPESKFDLTFYVLELGDAIGVQLVYNADLFDAPRMEELLRQYHVLLDRAARDPETPIGAISLLTPESAAVLPDPAAPLGETWHGAVHELFLEQERRQPGRMAVIDPEGSWTYGELAAAGGRLAAHLRAAGLERGDRVAIWAHRSAPVAWAVMGTLAAGGAFVMLDPAYPAARLIEILRLAEPRAWLALAAAGAPPREVEELLAGREREGRLLCRAVLPGGGPAGAQSLLATLPPAGAPAAVGPDDLAFVAFTSGSTGVPKGILGRHGPLSHFLPWQCRRFGLTAADRYSLLSGLAHDPLQRDLFTALCTGATLCAPDPEEVFIPGRLAAWAVAQGITVAHLTPALSQVLTEPPGDGSEPPPIRSLRWVFLVGDVLTRLDVDRLRRLAPGVTCVNLYGSTETQRAVGYHVIDPGMGAVGQRTRQVLPLGRGMEDVQILVVNAAERLAGVGEVGEIWMRSPHLAGGYLGDEALTHEHFRINPFTGRERDRVYRTGDLGRYLPDGEVAFAGRADNQVKIRGFRIEPGEIEATLGRLEGVRESVVVLREDGGERYLAAYVVPEPGTAPGLAGRLRPFLASRLPDYMVPAAFVELPALPLTANGKVDRRALPAPRRQGLETGAGPRTPLEEALAGIWAALLRRDRIGVHDNFFELGGHSLLATQLVSRVRKAFAVELPLRLIFETPTIAGLAAWIEQVSGQPSPAPPLRRARRDGPLPLSFAQERLWFLNRLQPGSPAYNMPTALQARGELSPALLEAILNEVVRRHEALRTTFPWRAGQPAQEIAPPRRWTLPLVDLSTLPEEVGLAEARRLAAEEAGRPFDLEQGPLLRASLLRLGSAEHALLLTLHHIVSDGWSMGVLVGEITALYRAVLAGRPSPLPELPFQYADFAVWQREWLTGAELERQLSYWRQRLAGAPDSLNLPTDRPRPATPTHRGGRVTKVWGPDLSRRLTQLALDHEATPFMVLLSGFQALLGRLTGQDDVPVGSPIANRNRMEIEPLIGFFVNTLVLRGDLSGDPPFRELLARVRRTTLEAYGHQDLPFEQLVETLRPQRSLAMNPLFQVIFALQNTPGEAVELPGLSFASLELERATARFDLELGLWEAGDSLVLDLGYSAELFDESTAQRAAVALETLLQGMLADDVQQLSELPLLPAAARHQIVSEWNDTRPALEPRNVVERFAAQVAATPDALALEAGGERLTYADLDRRANRLAHRLRRQGVGPEVVVGLFVERTPEVAAGILGIWKAGGAYLPLDPGQPRERLVYLLEDSRVPVIAVGAGLAAALPSQESRIVRLDDEDLARESDLPPAGLPEPGDLAYLIYTSGTTGKPKAVLIEHGSLASTLAAGQEAFDFRPADRVLSVASFSFDIFLVELLGPLLMGGSCVLLPLRPTLDLARLAGELASATVLLTVPAVMRQVMELARRGTAAPRLRALFLGGDTVPADLLADLRTTFPQADLSVAYGPTEAAIVCTRWRVPAAGPVPSLIGLPFAGAEIHVCGAGGRPVPIGVPGEIWIGGAVVARGYWRREELTAEKFVTVAGRRFFRSGDLARRRPDGTLEFLGRLDHQVKIRGFRIELGEIEAALTDQAGVREAVVLARDDGRAGERRLVAYVVAEPEAAPEAAALRALLASRLPAYMLPAAFVFLDALPLGAGDKIDRRALPAPEEAESAVEQRSVPPRTPLERFLAGRFRDVLGLPADGEIGLHDDFFDLGGTSITGAIFIHRLQEALSEIVHVVAIFDHPTVASLADYVREQHAAAALRLWDEEDGEAAEIVGAAEVAGALPGRGILVPLQKGAPDRRPLFCIHPVGGEVVAYRELARRLGPGQPVYGLQSPDPPLDDVLEMAARYLAAVREVQPEGPYRLAGWSMGGVVAYEMARQLEERGETAEVLALIDVASPSRWSGEPEPDGIEMVALFASDLARLHGLEVPPVDLSSLDQDAALAAVRDLGRQAGLLPPSAELSEVRRLFDRFRANRRALAAYEQRPYAGEVVLFRTARMGEHDPTLGWGELLNGRLRISDLPGDHYTLLKEEVGTLAARLREMLEG